MNELIVKYETTGRMLKSKLSRTDRQTFRPRFRWEMLIHIWISPRHWKDASGEKRSLGSDTLYVFLCLETQVYKYCRILGLTALNSLLQYVNWLVWEVCSVN